MASIRKRAIEIGAAAMISACAVAAQAESVGPITIAKDLMKF